MLRTNKFRTNSFRSVESAVKEVPSNESADEVLETLRGDAVSQNQSTIDKILQLDDEILNEGNVDDADNDGNDDDDVGDDVPMLQS